MRVAVIADVHANLAALDAVRGDWGTIDEVWCLGDLVGYGPDPNECINRLRELPHVAIPGNHDYAALGRIDLSDFNADARSAAEWTATRLSPASRAYLEALPLTLVREPFTLVHGSPRGPIWEYLLDTLSARACFPLFSTPYCLVGHSHVPLEFVETAATRIDGALLTPDGAIDLRGARRILNPGSVGQPRDGDPRASFATIEIDADGAARFELHRVEYPIAETQRRMREFRLPPRLITRLSQGR